MTSGRNYTSTTPTVERRNTKVSIHPTRLLSSDLVSNPVLCRFVFSVVFGGILTGYLLTRSDSETTRAGIKVGIVSGLPILWAVFHTYVAVAGFTVAGFRIAAVVGEIGVRIGTWLADTVEGRRNHGHSN